MHGFRRKHVSNGEKKNCLFEGQDNQCLRMSTFMDEEVGSNPPTKHKGNISWISQNFKKKTCLVFSPGKKSNEICLCGRHSIDHKGNTVEDGASRAQKTTWSKKEAMISQPTNAFGEIEFLGAGRRTRAKYARIADDSDPDKGLALLLNEWHLAKPKLLISVTGGAKNFKLDAKLKKLFSHGLLKVAQTSGAWVITGGTNTGVMKHVGEALQGAARHKYGRGHTGHGRNRVYCIGIATWGIVEHRNDLVKTDELISYQMTSSMKSYGACLDNNHTHFLLIDNGTIDQYGGEISFRAALENRIMNIKTKHRVGIPSVLLVVEGGPNTIKTVREAVSNDPPMPVVIIKDSGRAADLIAYAYDIVHGDGQIDVFQDAVEHQQLMVRIEQTNPGQTREHYLETYQNIVHCLRRKEYVTIFRMEEGSADIDEAILTALLKSESASHIEQLNLALAWNRADIARSQIFIDENKWELTRLEDAMMIALGSDKADFVDLLKDHGVDLDNFLSRKRLQDLYNVRKTTRRSIMKYIFGRKKWDTDEISLTDVNSVLLRLLGDTMENYYEKGPSLEHMFTEGGLVSKDLDKKKPKNASHELFIWAVICNMREMALHFWRNGEEALAKALIGCKMFQSMKGIAESENLQEDVINDLDQNMKEFQALAIQLLDECAKVDEQMAARLLTYELENWGNNTCLSLAVSAHLEEFVAHGSCQALLSDMWDGAMTFKAHQSLFTLMGIVCPPLIVSFKFLSRREVKDMPTTDEVHEIREYKAPENEEKDRNINESISNGENGEKFVVSVEDPLNASLRRSTMREANGGSMRQTSTLTTHSDLKWYEKFYEFYRAPITKFWSNVLVYLMFLCVFAYVVLVKLPPKPSAVEWVLIAFVITLTTEEIRQFLHSDADSWDRKLWEWSSSKWNICDGVAITLFFIGVVLRSVDETRDVGQVVYSLDIMLWIVRLLDIFSVNKHLGPYVVMIGRMTADMLYFLFIMAVFLLAYGVARKAILQPLSSPSWDLIKEVLFAPYFQVYGELFVEKATENETIYGSPKQTVYAEGLVTLIMAFYLLVANILLLNLLIAIFNHIYDEVEANSTQIWKFQRYHLIMEYSTRPFFVPPFIIINHLIMLVRWLSKCCRRKEKKQTRKLKFSPNKQDYHVLIVFEEDCLTSYLRAKDTLQLAGQEEKIRIMAERVHKIGNQVIEVSKEGFAREKYFKDTMKKIDGKVDLLFGVIKELKMMTEGDLSPSDPSRTGDVSPLPAVQMGKRHFSSRQSSFAFDHPNPNSPVDSQSSHGATLPAHLPSLAKREMDFVKKASETFRRGSVHSESNKSPARKIFSDIGQERKKNFRMATLDVVDDAVESRMSPPEQRVTSKSHRLRSKSCPSQNSMESSEQQKTERHHDGDDVVDTDYDVDKPHTQSRKSPYPLSTVGRYPVPDASVDWKRAYPKYDPPTFEDTTQSKEDDDYLDETAYNKIDGEQDRRSALGLYEVVDGWPRNPKGRTGLQGRGVLSRWGPNHIVECIITRWKKDDLGERQMRDNKPVLEFLAVKRQDEFAIPFGSKKSTLQLPRSVKDIVYKMLTAGQAFENIPEEYDLFFSSGQELYREYVDDIRNTDNAWIETTGINFHDDAGYLLQHLKIIDRGICKNYSWQEISSATRTCALQMKRLQNVAAFRAASYEVDSVFMV